MAKRRVGVGVVGMGWMGDVHARSYRAACHRYPDLDAEVELVACADSSAELAAAAAARHGFGRAETDYRRLLEDAAVDVVSVTAPNFLHAEVCVAAAAAGKHIWCEKPVGRDAAEAARVARAAAAAKVAGMAGFNYRWAPMVRHVAELLAAGELGEVEMFRGRFYSMYAFDRLGLFSWRFERAKAGAGAAGDLLSHVTDMALELAGPIEAVCAQQATFVKERPRSRPGRVSHYGRGAPDDPTAPVENEDFVGLLVRFAGGARGALEGWRGACGPKADMGFELYGTKGSAKWTLEDMNALRLFLRDRKPLDGYARVLGGEDHPDHGRFNPGDGNAIGYEDTKTIECAQFLRQALAGAWEDSGLRRASAVADVGAAALRSCASGAWEEVAAADGG